MSESKSSDLRLWDPFRDLGLLGARLPSLARAASLPGDAAAETAWTPVVDISETDDHFVVSVELAGAKKDDVGVELQDGVLTVRGEKRSEREEKDEKRHYVERSYGRFARSFQLPSHADPDRVSARFTDGVLTVEIAKREDDKPKAIQVH